MTSLPDTAPFTESVWTSQISGCGSYLPTRILTNAELETQVDTTREWIMERTGISERHIAAADQATSDLALIASQRALEMAGLQASQLDAILVATVSPDQVMPSTACVLQARLGCRSLMALDISAACSGFLYGLSIADQFIKAGQYQHVLVIGAETLSRIVDYRDRATCILFGDGAGAMILSRTRNVTGGPRIFSTHLHANGTLGELLTLPAGGSRIPFSQQVVDDNLQFVQMNGKGIFKAAVRALSDRCLEALAANQMTTADVDWFCFHQANLRIIEAVAQMLGVTMERVLLNVERTGNTSSASVPVLFDESVRAGQIKRGDRVLFAVFGGGLTSASAILKF
jgi:3-oxoacyl-[acyl-carrier-protein] synthase-3